MDLKQLRNHITSMSSPTVPPDNSNIDEPGNLNDSSSSIQIPKKSWFATLFKFRPESVVFTSNLPLQEVRSRIEKKLDALEVEVQPSNDGVSIKCKFDAQGSMKVIKFKITLAAQDNDDAVQVQCVQQMGALQTFQHFIELFKEDWLKEDQK